jgi:6-phosphogluconolactonase
MRMKLNKSSQLLLASAVSLAAAGFLSACATLTVDFVFVPSAKAAGANNYGEIDVFEVNSESGTMRQIPTSPFPSGGRNPVAEAVSSDNTNLYVVNRDDNTIVQFIIGNDGKVYPQNTINTPGIFPIATTVAGTNLFVADTYEPLPTCSSAAPCTGSFAVYPTLPASGSTVADTLQSPTPLGSCNGLQYQPLTLPGSASGDIILPTAITAYAGSATAGSATVYIAAYDTTSNAGYVFGYSVTTAQQTCTVDGQSETLVIPTVTPLSSSPWRAGIYPSGITTDPTGAYVYVTDSTSSDVLGFAASSGTQLSGSPYLTGNKPTSVVIDAKGQYAYVANGQDSTITAYAISSGALSSIGNYTTGTQPVAIGIDPSLNEYLYTANFLGNTVSGFQIQSSNGTLINSKGSSFASNANPTAIAAIPHGATSKK